jgi:hypothetical protein
MAAPDFSAAWPLYAKWAGLRRAGHVARSSEYTLRALAAAQAVGEPDCLIVALLQVTSAADRLVAADAATHDSRRAGLLRAPFETLFAAAATLQRRKAAGTLLAGACRPAEEAWYEQASVLMTTTWGGCEPEDVAADAADVAPLVGYELFLRTANLMLSVTDRVRLGQLLATPQQLRFALMYAADAVDVMAQPRIHEELVLPCEGQLAGNVKAFLTKTEPLLRLDEVGTRRLMECWDRLERSGVPQRRGFASAFDTSMRDQRIEHNAAAVASAAPGLRTCALATCGAREQHPAHFKSCAACRVPVYCCKEHQSEDWPSHKAACKAARKQAAERAG